MLGKYLRFEFTCFRAFLFISSKFLCQTHLVGIEWGKKRTCDSLLPEIKIGANNKTQVLRKFLKNKHLLQYRQEQVQIQNLRKKFILCAS